jgi:peptidoglycan/LPS O-acetylase OafA/YrhL
MPDQLLERSRATRRMLQLLPIAMVATVAAFVVAAYTLKHQHSQAVDTQTRICRVANGDRMVLRNLLQLAQTNSRISLKGHPAQLARAQAFYVQALALIVPVNCNDL